MRRSGRVVRQVLDSLRTIVAPGVSTMDLERSAEKQIRDAGAKPAFKGYYDYPCVLCTSINEEIVHGIPSEKRLLKTGDIVSIDCGVVMEGYYGDAAITVPVGNSVSDDVKKLLDVTEASLYKGIEQVRVGNTIGDVGAAVQEYVEANGFSVVREFVGHGVGRSLRRSGLVDGRGERGDARAGVRAEVVGENPHDNVPCVHNVLRRMTVVRLLLARNSAPSMAAFMLSSLSHPRLRSIGLPS